MDLYLLSDGFEITDPNMKLNLEALFPTPVQLQKFNSRINPRGYILHNIATPESSKTIELADINTDQICDLIFSNINMLQRTETCKTALSTLSKVCTTSNFTRTS